MDLFIAEFVEVCISRETFSDQPIGVLNSCLFVEVRQGLENTFWRGVSRRSHHIRKLSASVRCNRQNPLSLAVPLNFRSLRPSHILSWLGVHVVRLRILNDVQPI